MAMALAGVDASHFALYRATALGKTLIDSLDAMVETEAVAPQQAFRLLERFDAIAHEEIEKLARAQIEIKGTMDSYRCLDDVWSLKIRSVTVSVPTDENAHLPPPPAASPTTSKGKKKFKPLMTEIKLDTLKIVACGQRKKSQKKKSRREHIGQKRESKTPAPGLQMKSPESEGVLLQSGGAENMAKMPPPSIISAEARNTVASLVFREKQQQQPAHSLMDKENQPPFAMDLEDIENQPPVVIPNLDEMLM